MRLWGATSLTCNVQIHEPQIQQIYSHNRIISRGLSIKRSDAKKVLMGERADRRQLEEGRM